ncbi:MAG: hypothetical protein ACP5NU_01215 [Methanomicrobiales archaeon]
MTEKDQKEKSQDKQPAQWGDTDQSLRETIEKGDKRNLKRDSSLVPK